MSGVKRGDKQKESGTRHIHKNTRIHPLHTTVHAFLYNTTTNTRHTFTSSFLLTPADKEDRHKLQFAFRISQHGMFVFDKAEAHVTIVSTPDQGMCMEFLFVSMGVCAQRTCISIYVYVSVCVCLFCTLRL